MKDFLLYIWQLPQNIVGILVLKYHEIFCKHRVDVVTNSDGVTYYIVKHLNDCGISLGKYIIFDFDTFIRYADVNHEAGHQKQSLYLGWLYLLVIGLPSAIGNIIYRFHKFEYYKQPWEAWADKLGGVKRY